MSVTALSRIEDAVELSFDAARGLVANRIAPTSYRRWAARADRANAVELSFDAARGLVANRMAPTSYRRWAARADRATRAAIASKLAREPIASGRSLIKLCTAASGSAASQQRRPMQRG